MKTAKRTIRDQAIDAAREVMRQAGFGEADDLRYTPSIGPAYQSTSGPSRGVVHVGVSDGKDGVRSPFGHVFFEQGDPARRGWYKPIE